MRADTEIVPVTNVDAPWERIVSEPWLWFMRFENYYLPQGPGRTLYHAYELMLMAERPGVLEERKKLEATKVKGRQEGISAWNRAQRVWSWRERARAYDKQQYQQAGAQVELARITILNSANKAAEALVEALSNERLKVAAAKEILDRAGLPGTTNIGIGPADKFSADELSQAEAEINKWESLQPKLRLESNG